MKLPVEWRGWIPIRFYWSSGEPSLDWCFVGEHRFTAPFFDHDIDQCLQDPFKLLFRRQETIDALIERDRSTSNIEPSGFIFHLSRCGSTLMAQMLAAGNGHMIVSEASIVETVLRAGPISAAANDARIALLRAIIHAMGRPRNDEQSHVFVKFDNWHTVYLSLIRLAFPTVPWIFLYRDPIEILVSLHYQQPSRLIPGIIDPAQLGIGAEFGEMNQDEYNARVLTEVCKAAIDGHAPGLSHFVNYLQLPEFVTDRLPHIFRFPCPVSLRTEMRTRAKFNGKIPGDPFERDSARKQQAATDSIRTALVASGLLEHYEKMESIRLNA